ncbi:MAG: MIP/aquaporin family protein [Bryobacteraceae bacterium]
MASPWFGEFMGTFILILFGNGVCANVLLKRSKAEGAGWMVIATGWGLAVFAGVFTAIACGSHDAHLNPAITLAVAIETGNFAKLLPYSSAQLLGAFTGAALVWLHFWPHWKVTDDAATKFGVFATSPAIPHRAANLLSEIVGTFVLVLVAAALGSKAVSATGTAPGLGPYLVGCLVWGIGLSLGGTTGYAINPARDLGPRLAHALLPIAGKGSSNWSYAPIPILGPLTGAALAGWLIRAVGF